ncbi:hypothetical protein L6452_09100 [Arctium lappa]|uniref:Uncharacterized protein n=1 Tax=Arctium lappa TaxID=4217 RepID=A0ACB9DJM5_ARCLA|nr:hypothetical protein L6452_09100 [Arctium lappa]
MMALAVRQLHRSSEVMLGKKLAIDSSFREVKLPREAFTDIEFHHSSYNFRRAGMCPRLDTECKCKRNHDNDRTKLIGNRNLGKGKIQSVTELHDGSTLFITVAKYLSPALDDID